MAIDVLAKAKPSMKQQAPEAEITPVLGTGTEVTPRVPNIPEQPIIQEATVSGYEGTGTPEPIVDSMGEGNLPKGNYYTETAPLVSSWESKAQQMSESQFRVDLNKANQTMLRSRQQMEQEGQQGQTELALGEYMRGQSAEKAGWTGGYMLDQKRQGDYLRASIQAQMYGAQELQKYGMDTQLEAARLSYDLGKQNLAYKLYQDAQQMAVTEAQMFGYYVSPEIRDLLNQRTAAQSVLSGLDSTTEEKERAQRIIEQVDTWFGEQNLDPSDISKFGQITMEREQQNQAKLDAVLATIGDDPSTFLARNADGSYTIDKATGQYVKLNFADLTKEDLYNFLRKDDASENKFADGAFKSYARFLGQSSIAAYLSSLDEDAEPTQAGFAAYIATEGNDRLAAYFEELGLTKEEAQAIIGESFTASLTSGGKTISYGYGSTSSSGVSGQTPNTEPEFDLSKPETVIDYYKDPFTGSKTTWENITDIYGEFSDKTNQILNSQQIALLFKSDVNYFNKLSTTAIYEGNQIPTANDKKKVYDIFFRLHLMSNESDPTKTGINIFAKRFGIPANAIQWSSEKFTSDTIAGAGYGFKINAAKLNQAKVNQLKAMGFKEQGGLLVFNTVMSQSQAGGETRAWSVEDQDGSYAHYPPGSGWNTGKWGELKVLASLMMWFESDVTGWKSLVGNDSDSDLTTTTEGESRF